MMRLRSFQDTPGFRTVHHAVVAAGILAAMSLSVPDLAPEEGLFEAVLWAALAFFAAVGVLHVTAASVVRWDAARIATALVDAVSVLPVPVLLAFRVAPHTAWLLASLWILRLSRFSSGLKQLVRVLEVEGRPLAGVFVIFLTVLVLGGTAMHALEREAQPGVFGTVPQGLWWAVTTLTTTGYGDAVPQTHLGRLLAGLMMVCGIGVFALWAGILATGFAAESRRQDFLKTWDLIARVPFFRSLGPAAITEIARRLRHWQVPEGTVVVRRGRPGDCMYFIASGEVEVDIRPMPIRLGAGAFFGELALVHGGPRSATVTATRPSLLLILDVADFRELCASRPELGEAIEAEAARRAGPAEVRAQAG